MNILNVRWRGRLDLFDNMPKDCRNETTFLLNGFWGERHEMIACGCDEEHSLDKNDVNGFVNLIIIIRAQNNSRSRSIGNQF